MVRHGYALLAWICITLAMVGLVVPGLPTTPFLLLGAWAASRGSERLHRWLYRHPRLGPVLRDWQEQRAVKRSSKALAIALLAASWAISYWKGASAVVLTALAVLFLVLIGFLVTRPVPRGKA